MAASATTGWIRSGLIGLLVWAVLTAGLVAVAPLLAGVPTGGPALGLAAAVTLACFALGYGLGALVGRGPTVTGTRLGVSVLVLGQLLDAVLVLVLGGYPRAGEGDGQVVVLAVLLAGYPAFAVGAVLADRRRGPAVAGPTPAGVGQSSGSNSPEPR